MSISVIKRILKNGTPVFKIFDLIFFPVVLFISLWLRLIKFIGLKHFSSSTFIFKKVGVFPIVNHYYDPEFLFNDYSNNKRKLKAINFNGIEQNKLLCSFNYQNELLNFPKKKVENEFYYHNGSFPSGDAELYYSMIRKFKPQKIIEIGSGFSTLIALEAINTNKAIDVEYNCQLSCIEPYEMPWLNSLNINVYREKVENVGLPIFQTLKSGDLLFIDSSHIIKPQGDVVFELLQLLPNLEPGVFIHFHDIFSPYNYPVSWLKEEFRLWNEQYLLEAFLSYNNQFKIIAAMAYLKDEYPQSLRKAFPVLNSEWDRSPGSFWLQKIY